MEYNSKRWLVHFNQTFCPRKATLTKTCWTLCVVSSISLKTCSSLATSCAFFFNPRFDFPLPAVQWNLLLPSFLTKLPFWLDRLYGFIIFTFHDLKLQIHMMWPNMTRPTMIVCKSSSFASPHRFLFFTSCKKGQLQTQMIHTKENCQRWSMFNWNKIPKIKPCQHAKDLSATKCSASLWAASNVSRRKIAPMTLMTANTIIVMYLGKSRNIGKTDFCNPFTKGGQPGK